MTNLFKMFSPQKMVGIDIGTSSVKIVEISRWGQGKTLENYGEIKSNFILKETSPNGQNGSSMISSDVIAKVIRAVLNEARIKTKAAIFSLPDFYTFSTSFEIPSMPAKEIPGAVFYNASQHITLPISEVTLDWKIISNNFNEKNTPLKVFLIAIPNQVIQDYKTIANIAGLKLYAIEAEVSALIRSLIKNNKKTVCLMDIGVQSATVSIIDNGFLRRSYSFDFHSSQLMDVVSSVLGIERSQAEEIKNKEGIISSKLEVAEALYPLIDPLLTEIRSISSEFFQIEEKQVQEIYLTGGTANLPGLKEYFKESLNKNVYVPNCFADLLYPPILEENLQEMNPSFSVAVGAALSGL